MITTIGPPVDADLATIPDVVQAQDVSWWGQAEVDAEDLDQMLAQIRRACGSIETGGRVAVRDGEVVGFAVDSETATPGWRQYLVRTMLVSN